MKRREFIGEPIEVVLPPEAHPPRSPPAPEEFHWRRRVYRVEAVFQQWWDFDRQSRRQQSYGEEYQRTASRRGSYGMGRCYYLVRAAGEIFLIYYDRRPSSGSPGGSWVLLHRLWP